MNFKVFHINAFVTESFLGNPACVIPLKKWPSSSKMLAVAKKNNVSETAFYIKKHGKYLIKWFTPDIEMDLCGHATLATAHCIISHTNENKKKINFESNSGELEVVLKNELYEMNLPKRSPKVSTLPKPIYDSLSIKPFKVLRSRDYVLVYDSVSDIKKIKIDRELFDKVNIDPGGVVLTSKGENSDFVSRYFTPQSTYFEDPVTGSSHCSLIPYWSNILNKNKMISHQLSKRGGELICKNLRNRVLVSGKAETCYEHDICV
jgi:PhzF family phenazine biosynthesis protein